MSFEDEADPAAGTPAAPAQGQPDLLSSFDFRQLYYFCAVVDGGSFSRASDLLHIAQPWLSTQVRKLETRIGRPLLERHSGTLTLTDAGAALHVRATRFLREARALGVTLDSLRRSADQASAVVPAELAMVRCEVSVYPLQIAARATGLDLLFRAATEMEVRIDTVVNVVGTIERIRRGTCDLALCLGPLPADGLEHIPAFAEEAMIAMPDTDPLAHQKIVNLADIAGRRIAAPARSHHPWHYQETYLPLKTAGAELVPIRDQTMKETFRMASDLGILTLSPRSAKDRLPDGMVTRPFGPGLFHVQAAWVRASDLRNPMTDGLWESLAARRRASGHLDQGLGGPIGQ
jgi:DNA-binding transcriptional LysR family regulator